MKTIKTQILILNALCLAMGSSLTACTEEAAKRPTGAPISQADADKKAAEEEAAATRKLEDLEREKALDAEAKKKLNDPDVPVETLPKPKEDVPELVPAPPKDPKNDMAPPVVPEPGREPTPAPAPERPISPAPGPDAPPEVVPDPPVVESDQVVLKSLQATVISAVSDDSKICYVPNDKAILVSDVKTEGKNLTFKLVSLVTCPSLKGLVVTGLAAHIRQP